jgi:hypothetical protein
MYRRFGPTELKTRFNLLTMRAAGALASADATPARHDSTPAL